MAIATERVRTAHLAGSTMSGADVLVHSLYENGVETTFGIQGGAIMPTFDALYKAGQIRHVSTRHEQAAAHAAEGYAWVTGKPGVVLVTSGPGATNTITGINNAYLDSTPLVVIAAQVATTALGKQSFQEAPMMEISQSIVKRNYQITSASEIPHVLSEAFRIATSGRPGPVVIDFPKDIQLQKVAYYPMGYTGAEQLLSPDSLRKCNQAADLINQAERPYLLVGHGARISRAEEILLKLAEKAGIPVAITLPGKSVFPENHELFVGMVGMHGGLAANSQLRKADLLVALGTRFADRVTGTHPARFAPQARIVHIDIEPSQLNKIITADLPIQADVKAALAEIIKLVESKKHPEWLKQFKNQDEIEYNRVSRRLLLACTGDITTAEVTAMLSEKTQGQAIMVTEVGQHQMKAARFYKSTRPNSFITSAGFGAMGFGFPASIGVKIAAPDRQVIAFCGDGSIQMNIQEFITLVQEDVKVKVVIVDNGGFGMVRQWQDHFHGGRYAYSKQRNPDFVMLARASGIRGERVDQRAHLSGAVDRALSAKEPYVVHILVSPDENVFPMIPPGSTAEDIILE